MRVLITGKNGQLGRSIHKLVSENQYDEKFSFVGRGKLDLSNKDNITAYFNSNDKFDVVINCAAYTAVDKAEEDIELANQVNYLAVKQLAEIAKAQEARAKVILAEAEVPKAMAEAFRQGNLGIMDYYKFQNIQADTGMRESIADDKSKESGGKTEKGSKSE